MSPRARAKLILAAVLVLLGAAAFAAAQSPAARAPRVGLLGVTSAAGYARQVEAALRQGRLGELAAAKGLPGAGSDEFADGGGLLAYGVHFPELWRRAPYFVDRILKGTKPGAIPVEQASKFSLVLNLKGAKALGLPIQQSLVLRADQVIE